MTYAELQVTTHFSFLRGASSPDELFAAAAALGITALGVVDRGSVAGLVRAHEAARATGVRLVAGARLDIEDGAPLLVYPTDRASYGRLTRLLSLGKARAGKGACRLGLADVAAWGEGMIAVLVPGRIGEALPRELAHLREAFGDRAYCALTRRFRQNDAARLHAIDEMARAARVPGVATNDVLYHAAERRMLQDVVTCIREGCTIDDAGFRRERFADRFLKAPAEMERLFARHPDAIRRTGEIVARCRFSLDELRYQYPQEVAEPGLSAMDTLERLSLEGARERYPQGVPERVMAQLRHELELIRRLDYASYFLTVHAIVRFARSREILCQGRGSAANSIVCYCLGITSIDPVEQGLLFERFVSEARNEPPDIDVDFEHERREEVIQWVYDTYGRHRAALCATVIRYRSRGAVREVGKVMGLPEDVTAALSGLVWGWSTEGVGEREAKSLNLNLNDRRLQLTLQLARELIGTPRHLSQHPGGFVLTQDRLDELVPIEPASMADRQVIEWDKDDIDSLKFMKVDVLGLGMLGCMRRAFDLLEAHRGIRHDLATIPIDDEPTYRMIRRADTLGTFQIESRAQMAMLPRMKPRNLYDLTIQVAIVRPGPIQGDMVHPYLRRREGREQVTYPKPELEAVLGRTLGVPLFQEQAMKVAIVAAGFTATEADELRRSMATFKFTGGVNRFRDKLVAGMISNGYPPDFAERTFRQLEGFGSYGFPESHAASFAKIAYASSWMKCHHPDVFCCALLNAQPMGFYAPAQIVRDACAHGVEIRAIDVNQSRWDCTLEETGGRLLAVRLGLRMAKGLANADGARLVAVRGASPPGDAPASAPQDERARSWPGRGGAVAPHPPLHLSPARGERDHRHPSHHPLDHGRDGHAPLPPCGGDAPQGQRGVGEAHASPRDGTSQRSPDGHDHHRPGEPFDSIEALKRRTGLPVAALERLADADAFGSLGLSRRDALWAIRGLSGAPLPLFEAADAREAAILPELDEPAVALTPMTPGREVVEDYRAQGLSLRAHPLAFLRGDLARQRMRPCQDLAATRDGRWITVAGLVLVRQKPGSAKGVMFITLEDETDIANVIVWPQLFERRRRLILSAAMMGVRGRVQREGEVIHLVAHDLADLSDLLRGVGDRNDAFPLSHGRGDEARGGTGADPRGGLGRKAREIYIPDLHIDSLKVRTRDFR
ncbi:error-prone DNA polymerase [Salinarimonas soli]|uniref:Error-prone DNA polymerase n=1 Tax=Salinarimonas soli TaxID=1638099 RepID=A0A5B2V2S0_9HYPH|nr:error-prone DNA polymerase [Salinarimonas soli]KAA2233141.1 DNA polymerase III subunit alpha [Salinarimonas soli]